MTDAKRLSLVAAGCERAEAGVEAARKVRDEHRAGFGLLVRRIRTEHDVSLRQFARDCNVSPQMMCDFEKGRRWSDNLATAAQEHLHRVMRRLGTPT